MYKKGHDTMAYVCDVFVYVTERSTAAIRVILCRP